MRKTKGTNERLYYWIACTKDKYELPIFVEETCVDLAKKIGVRHSAITNCIRRKTTTRNYKIVKVRKEE